MQLAQVAVAICQVAGGTVWDWDWYWLLAAGCLVSCLSRWRGSHVACLLGSQGKRKTFACLPLARAAEGGTGKERRGRGGEKGHFYVCQKRNTRCTVCCFPFAAALSALLPCFFLCNLPGRRLVILLFTCANTLTHSHKHTLVRCTNISRT